MGINENELHYNFGLGIGLCFGSLSGFIVGMLINNILIGFSSGAAIGVVLGSVRDEIVNFRNKRAEISNIVPMNCLITSDIEKIAS